MSTPFVNYPSTYPGAAPDLPAVGLPRSYRLWLGKPGNMIELPSPDTYSWSGSQGEVLHGLSGGGTSTTFFPDVGRQWVLSWPYLAGRDLQVVNGFYRRLFGYGPWCFTPAEYVNRMTLAQSMCDVSAWNVSAGTVSNPAGYGQIAPSNVLTWHGAGSGSNLACGVLAAGAPAPDLDFSAPYIAAEYATSWQWLWTASGTASVSVRLNGLTAAGGVVQTIAQTVTLTTTPRLYAVTAGPGDLGASVYAVPSLQCLTASAPDINMSNAQLELNPFVSDWQAGGGIPRVTWPVGAAGAIIPEVGLASSAAATFTEAIVGAA